MNIFALDRNPIQAARWQCDQHVVKMPTESFQMLTCAAIRHKTPTSLLPLTKAGTPAKGGYHRHPCSIWAGNTRANYLWLIVHAKALCTEYQKRYNKTHFCENGIKKLGELFEFIPLGQLEEFRVAISQSQSCRKIDGFDSLSVIDQYRAYYSFDKNFATWKRNKPFWLKKTKNEN